MRAKKAHQFHCHIRNIKSSPFPPSPLQKKMCSCSTTVCSFLAQKYNIFENSVQINCKVQFKFNFFIFLYCWSLAVASLGIWKLKIGWSMEFWAFLSGNPASCCIWNSNNGITIQQVWTFKVFRIRLFLVSASYLIAPISFLVFKLHQPQETINFNNNQAVILSSWVYFEVMIILYHTLEWNRVSVIQGSFSLFSLLLLHRSISCYRWTFDPHSGGHRQGQSK